MLSLIIGGMSALNKKHFIIVGIVFIGLILITLSFTKISGFFTKGNGFHVTTYNNTNTQIKGLKITYHNIIKDIEVPPIESNQRINLVIIPKESFGENQMKITYENSNGDKQSMVIVGYFEKGYSGNVTVKISSKGSSGFLVFDVDEDISVH